MPNGTYGGVRGRKTKVGRKLLRFPPTRLNITLIIFIISLIYQIIPLCDCVSLLLRVCVKAHRKFLKNISQKVCRNKKLWLSLHRYPENNLFTLKETNTY